MRRVMDHKIMDVLFSSSERDLFQAGERGMTKAEICSGAQERLVNGPKISGGEKARFFELVLSRVRAVKTKGRFYHGSFVPKHGKGEATMAGKSSPKIVKKGPATEAERLAAGEVRKQLISLNEAGYFMPKADMVEIAAKSMGIPADKFPMVRFWTLCALVQCKNMGNNTYKYNPPEERKANAAKLAERKAEKTVAAARASAGLEDRVPDYVFEAGDVEMTVEVKNARGKASFKGTAAKVVIFLLPFVVVACLLGAVLAYLPH